MATTQSPDHLTGHATATDSTTKDHQMSPDNSTIYIVAGTSAGVLLILTLVMVIIFCKRKSFNKTRGTNKSDIAFSNEQDDPDYDGLKYNVLYVSAEYGVDNSTVENENPHINYTVTEHDINYTTVGDLVPCAPSRTAPQNGNLENLDLGPSYESNKGTVVSKFDNVIPQAGNCNVYAAVDKQGVKIDNNSKPDNSSHIYAVVDKTKQIKTNN
ncbi:Hypothetical predicted protein [Mytilus galloprovincialis]|uniref:Uncharacterized protein n=1 Tax=Mytilus galloprovincialis TaxID=29158 RepID=A0A8B6E7A0_MYTGA|nr:Hypothetical predicted protein [Mytilus galloprovincialis]